MKFYFPKILFLLFFSITGLIFSLIFFKPIFIANDLIIPYSLEPFNICKKYPEFWYYFKIVYLCLSFISNLIISNSIYFLFFKNKTTNKNAKEKLTNTISGLSLKVGFCGESPIYLPEKSLYQNILITGTTGSGKTSSAMYPFCRQLIDYKSSEYNEKLGMLVLDVKGNFYKKVLEFAEKANRKDDVILIEPGSNFTYNPLDKPELKASVLADRLKTILLLFSPNNSDSYWLDKAAQLITECIKFCRLYNDGYVTFDEINKLIFYRNYYNEKQVLLRNSFQKAKFTEEQSFDLLSAINFFETEFKNLDERVVSIIKSEISRITSMFISDYTIKRTFCPNKEKRNINFFRSAINEGKIVVLNMNLSEYQNLAKFIAAYLKLDFQGEILNLLKNTQNIRQTVFMCDEFHEFVTKTDASFFAQSREAKCINIVATQSYSSLVNTLKDPTCTRVLTQSLINKLWFRTDDSFTIEEIQKQLGKEDKEKTSYTISENAKETNYHYLTNRFHSNGSNLSESLNTYSQRDFIYDTNFFTCQLPVFNCLAFLSDGEKILKPCKLKMIPYFQFETTKRKELFNEIFFKS